MRIALPAVALLFLLLALCVAPRRPRPDARRAFMHRSFAHRGLHTQDASVPENSMAAFRAAVSAGYGIETDIQLSKDGQVVIFHDDTLRRVCGEEGRVDAYTYEELRGFALSGTDERIPLFTDFLRLVDGRVPLIIELKTGPRNAELCQKAWALLVRYSGAFCVESFDPRIVAWFRIHAKQVLRGQLAAGYRELKKSQSAAVSFAVSRCLVNCIGRPDFIAYDKKRTSWCAGLAYNMGAMAVVWTVRPGDDIPRLQEENDAVIFEYFAPRMRY